MGHVQHVFLYIETRPHFPGSFDPPPPPPGSLGAAVWTERAVNQGTGSAQPAELLGILEKQLVRPAAGADLTR